MNTFQDIKITGMNDEESSKPDPSMALYDIVLTLSESAPYEWADYFNQRWKQHFYMMKRRASVSGSRLTVCCVPEELESQVNELKKVITETNQKYKEHFSIKQNQEEAKKQEEKVAKEKLSNLKDSIKFD